MAMMLSQNWLKEWGINQNSEKIRDVLTNNGLEVDNIIRVHALDSKIIVGKIVSVVKHPNADKLNICQVQVSYNNTVQIICGCASVKPELKVCVAMVGATLPGGLNITQRSLRGVDSHGMLCSRSELGLETTSPGIWHLENHEEIGVSVASLCDSKSDEILEVEITPNRGDCLSILGLSRELKGFFTDEVTYPFKQNNLTFENNLLLDNLVPDVCLGFSAIKISNLDLSIPTPRWLRKRLEIFSQTSVNLVVDVLNYVMFELGQPMHAYDASKIEGNLTVRLSKNDLKVRLIDGSEPDIPDNLLVVSDAKKIVALAGVIGSDESSVTENTNEIILECASFDANMVAKTLRTLSLASQSSYRFERGVDYHGATFALNRAIALLLDICPSAKIVSSYIKAADIEQKVINFSIDKVARILGHTYSAAEIMRALNQVGCAVEDTSEHVWKVTVPSFRTDLIIVEDLVEEVLRLNGIDNLVEKPYTIQPEVNIASDFISSEYSFRDMLAGMGLNEHIGYSFVAAKKQNTLEDNDRFSILNPISAELNVMRQNCWIGLLDAAKYNLARQKNSVSLFEIGNCFYSDQGDLKSSMRVSGILTGKACPMCWHNQSMDYDFYHAKAICEKILNTTNLKVKWLKLTDSEILHPGKAAKIMLNGKEIGRLGVLHPSYAKQYKLNKQVVLFEMQMLPLVTKKSTDFSAISKYPKVRRDICLIVDQDITYADIDNAIKDQASVFLTDSCLFDIYCQNTLKDNKKSVTIALWFQSHDQTLTDVMIDQEIDNLVNKLSQKIGAKIRD